MKRNRLSKVLGTAKHDKVQATWVSEAEERKIQNDDKVGIYISTKLTKTKVGWTQNDPQTGTFLEKMFSSKARRNPDIAREKGQSQFYMTHKYYP